MSQLSTGWHCEPASVEQVTDELIAAGSNPVWGSSKPDLKGFGQRCIDQGENHVQLWNYEKVVWGKFLSALLQRRGTCVGCGTARALQYSWYAALVYSGEIGREKVEVALEPIYGGARVEIGGGRLSGDGAVGAHAAKYVHDYGVVPRGVYGQYDLSKMNESLAVSWGTRGRGVPSEIKQAGKLFRVRAHRLMRASDVLDAIYAKKAVAYCSALLWSNTRDRDGISEVVGSTAHCECMAGAWVTKRGQIVIGTIRSWGENYQRGPTEIEVKGGETITLPNHAYGARIEDVDKGLRSYGEAWAFEFEEGKGIR